MVRGPPAVVGHECHQISQVDSETILRHPYVLPLVLPLKLQAGVPVLLIGQQLFLQNRDSAPVGMRGASQLVRVDVVKVCNLCLV